MTIKDKLIKYSLTIGVDDIGFCNAAPFYELKNILNAREKKGYRCELENDDIEQMIYPELTMKNAKSFIAIAEGYNRVIHEDIDGLVGNISHSAITIDYHKTVMLKLKQLEEYLHTLTKCDTLCFVDISPFSDRAVGERAGLGYIGYNSMLISEKLGTHFFIGYILTDLTIEPDVKEHISDCVTCNLCVKACPAGALKGGGLIDTNRCISYLTQTKKEIKPSLKSKMGNQLYGCDSCQQICPKNKIVVNSPYSESIIPPKVNLESVLNLSNKAFKETFGITASGWRGKKILQRNAIIALGNSKDKEALDILRQHKEDIRPDIRKEIVSAIGRLGFSEGIEVLNNMLQKEKDHELKQFMSSTIETLKGM